MKIENKSTMGNTQIDTVQTFCNNTYQFVQWVASEIFDECWEYNKDAFAEIACRKLEKLGIVRANGDVWELVDPQEVRSMNDSRTI